MAPRSTPREIPASASRVCIVSSSQFTRSCLTCHGPEGGGNGPSAAALTAIPPRDYRSGAFVHFPDHLRPRPSREDLVDVLYDGVVGTSMQSFKSLPSWLE